MKKIIYKKAYDTENAVIIDSHREFLKEFIYYTETLYLHENGNFYLHVDAMYNPEWYSDFASEQELYHSYYCQITGKEALNWLNIM